MRLAQISLAAAAAFTLLACSELDRTRWSARLGSSEAQRALGERFATGDGVEQNLDEASGVAREGGRERIDRRADAPRDPLRRARGEWRRRARRALDARRGRGRRRARPGAGRAQARRGRQRDRSGTVDRARRRSGRSARSVRARAAPRARAGQRGRGACAARARRGSRQSRRGLGDGAEREGRRRRDDDALDPDGCGRGATRCATRDRQPLCEGRRRCGAGFRAGAHLVREGGDSGSWALAGGARLHVSDRARRRREPERGGEVVSARGGTEPARVDEPARRALREGAAARRGDPGEDRLLYEYRRSERSRCRRAARDRWRRRAARTTTAGQSSGIARRSEAGFAPAFSNLAKMVEEGRGTPADPAEALRLYQRGSRARQSGSTERDGGALFARRRRGAGVPRRPSRT